MAEVNKDLLRRLALEWLSAFDRFDQTGNDDDAIDEAWQDEASPEIVLALLDESDAQAARIAELEREACHLLKNECAHSANVIAQLRAELEACRKDAERYRWLCEKFGVTKLPCAIERILEGDVYVPDGKNGIDTAIDAAMKEASDNAAP